MKQSFLDFPEMVRQVRDYQRAMARLLVPCVILGFGSMVLLIIASTFLGPPGQTPPSDWRPLLGWLIATGGAFFLLSRFMPAAPKFPCPHCQVDLIAEHRWPIAFATGYCSKCLQPLFQAEETPTRPNPQSPLITREDFQRRQTRFGDPAWHLLIVHIVAVIAMSCSVGLAKYLEEQRQSPDAFSIYRIIIPVVISGMALASVIIYSRRRIAKLRSCCCLGCGRESINGPLTLITGHCSSCGEPLFADPLPRPPWPVCEQPMALAWYRVHGGICQKWLWICCIAGMIPTMLLAVWLLSFFPEPRTNDAAIFVGFLCGTCTIYFLGVFGFHWCIAKRFIQNCPHCQHDLSEVSCIVLASRNCPYCATTILVDSSLPAD